MEESSPIKQSPNDATVNTEYALVITERTSSDILPNVDSAMVIDEDNVSNETSAEKDFERHSQDDGLQRNAKQWGIEHSFFTSAQREEMFADGDNTILALIRATKRLDRIKENSNYRRVIAKLIKPKVVGLLNGATISEILDSTGFFELIYEVELAAIENRFPETDIVLPYTPDPEMKWIMCRLAGTQTNISLLISTILKHTSYDIGRFCREYNSLSLFKITPEVVKDWVHKNKLSHVSNAGPNSKARQDLFYLDGFFEFFRIRS